MKCRVTLQLAAWTLLAAGVEAAPPPGFKLAAETRHFVFYSRESRKVEADRSEKFLLRTADLLSHDLQGRVTYYLHEHPQDVAAATGIYADGVTVPATGEIHSVRAYHPHEIVHSLADELGDPGPFFHEGLAVALGNEGRWRGARVDEIARKAAGRHRWRGLVDEFDRLDPEVGYPIAGSFVGFLVRTHGAQRVAAFFRGCRRESRDRRFHEVFGITLDEAGQAWASAL